MLFSKQTSKHLSEIPFLLLRIAKKGQILEEVSGHVGYIIYETFQRIQLPTVYIYRWCTFYVCIRKVSLLMTLWLLFLLFVCSCRFIHTFVKAFFIPETPFLSTPFTYGEAWVAKSEISGAGRGYGALLGDWDGCRWTFPCVKSASRKMTMHCVKSDRITHLCACSICFCQD